MRRSPLLIGLMALLLVAGCAATRLKPAAAGVLATRQAAPPGCRYLGTVVGEQGGSIEGAYTSNKSLAVGAMNDLKNKAHELGANYVVIEDSKAGTTLSGSKHGVSGGQTDVTNIGNAYLCPTETETTTTAGKVSGS